MKRLELLCMVLILVTIIGCSIFDGLYPDKDTGTQSVTDLIALGDTALQKGDVDSALNYYNRAIIASSGISAKARRGYATAYALKKNADLLYLASKMTGKSADQIAAVSFLASSLTNTMSVLIDKLAPISQGACDGSIAANDFEVNLNLMLAYFIRGFLRCGDYNGDGIYFGPGDIFIIQDGQPGPNPAVVPIEPLQKSMEDTLVDIQKSFDAIKMPIPVLLPLPRSMVSNNLVAMHDVIESLLLIYRYFDKSFDDFRGAKDAMSQGLNSLTGNTVMDDAKKSANTWFSNMEAFLNNAHNDTTALNDDYYRVLGINVLGYGGYNWYKKFSQSAWPDSPPSSATYASDKTNHYKIFSLKSGDYFSNLFEVTSDTNYLKDVMGTMSKLFVDITNANLVRHILNKK